MEGVDVFDVFAKLLENGDINGARHLFAYPSATLKGVQGHGVLTHVCEFGPDDPDLLRHFIEMGATLELDSSHIRGGPIHSAAATNKPKMLRMLLDLGTPANLFSYRYTPLDNTFGFNSGELANAFAFKLLICYEESRMCAKILLDAGAQLSECKRDVPQWVHEYVSTRKKTRAASIAILGLLVCKSSVISCVGRDILRVLARCVWSMRGLNTK